jgi:hypothetical protein
MIGFTCREHIATEIAGRTPVLCPRWVPGFARACCDCGAPSYRGSALVSRILAGTAFDGLRGGNVATTVRRMSEASAGFRARKARERVTS